MWSALLRRLGSKLVFQLLQFHRFLLLLLFFFIFYFLAVFVVVIVVVVVVVFLRFSPSLADIAMGTTALCVVLSLLVVLFSTTEVTSCYAKANGCSIPGNLPFFYKRTFKPACDKHDVCYYCVRLAASFSYHKFIRMTATMSHLHK